ncbi:MAG: type III-A CRISPR-associated protein Cas10/Csm1 [Anaerolineae bacterium]|jgi:CRISPR-associated protein Csm1|nr:type III-A CRISPR-associated protein Cas10/Csm1 [Anaerolineae bacterium]
MNQHEETYLAALAGLLHDVGKFAQRAGDERPIGSEGVSQGLPLPDFLRDVLPLGDTVDTLTADAGSGKRIAWLVKAANTLATGERANRTSRGASDAPPSRQLLSIFSVIDADGTCWKNDQSHWKYLPLRKLALDNEGIFPGAALAANEVQSATKGLWNAFKTEAAALKSLTDPGEYLEAMLALLQRYGWCVPSTYADVSLYDHSRMTAALATCLADATQFPAELLAQLANAPEQNQTEVALLIGGDISGVQDFIYTITNKGATPALRGRSFYLQVLTEATARFVLRELDLPYTNLIYGGGGNFYILARAEDATKLGNLRQKLSRILYQHHRGDLYIAIEGLGLQAKDFMSPKNSSKHHPLSEKWGELARRIAVAKNQRFAQLETGELSLLFTPQGSGGTDAAQCQVCGREHPKTVVVRKDSEDQGVRKCPVCLSFESLGEKLRKAKFVGWKMLAHPTVVPQLQGNEIYGNYEQLLHNMGFEIEVSESIDEIQHFSHIWALHDAAFDEAQKRTRNKVLSRRLLVNVTPIISRDEIRQLQGEVDDLPDIGAENPVKPFGALAYQSQGITRLGVFRADVDNLGRLFAEGLGNTATLSRIASLSLAISLFFEGWVGKLAQEFNEERRSADAARRQQDQDAHLYGDALYAIYSGGDDLFFVGSWDVLVEFAWRVSEDLKQYTGCHPGIHISGGVALVTEKYPLAKAAQDAAHAEAAAKNLEWWDEQDQRHNKNAIALLGQSLSWSDFQHARNLKAQLEALDSGQRMAVIRKLLLNYALYAEAHKRRSEQGKDRKAQGKPQTLYGPWNWRIVYLLKRNLKEQIPEHQQLTEQFHVLPGSEKQPNYARLDWVGVAARWVELEDRK